MAEWMETVSDKQMPEIWTNCLESVPCVRVEYLPARWGAAAAFDRVEIVYQTER